MRDNGSNNASRSDELQKRRPEAAVPVFFGVAGCVRGGCNHLQGLVSRLAFPRMAMRASGGYSWDSHSAGTKVEQRRGQRAGMGNNACRWTAALGSKQRWVCKQ